MIIHDGAGSSKKAKVDNNFRLLVDAKSSSEMHWNSKSEGETYDFSTGDFISITSTDTETGIFYLKNTSTTKNLVIHSIRTCAEAAHKLKIYKNPTTGTLISGAVDAVETNLNFTSSNTADAIAYKGAEGTTISGTVMTQHINNTGHSIIDFDGSFLLGPGNSFAVSFELAAAGDCCIRCIGYFENQE
jgi:hypothetical protein